MIHEIRASSPCKRQLGFFHGRRSTCNLYFCGNKPSCLCFAWQLLFELMSARLNCPVEAAGGERDFLLVLTKGVTLGRGLPDKGYSLEDVSFEHYSVDCYASGASGFCGVGRVSWGLRGTLFGLIACEGSTWINLPCLGVPPWKKTSHIFPAVSKMGYPLFQGALHLGNIMRKKSKVGQIRPLESNSESC